MYLPPQIVFIYNERGLWGSDCAATNSDYSAEKLIPCKKINASRIGATRITLDYSLSRCYRSSI